MFFTMVLIKMERPPDTTIRMGIKQQAWRNNPSFCGTAARLSSLPDTVEGTFHVIGCLETVHNNITRPTPMKIPLLVCTNTSHESGQNGFGSFRLSSKTVTTGFPSGCRSRNRVLWQTKWPEWARWQAACCMSVRMLYLLSGL